jgi:hypothetical protein
MRSKKKKEKEGTEQAVDFNSPSRVHANEARSDDEIAIVHD